VGHLSASGAGGQSPAGRRRCPFCFRPAAPPRRLLGSSPSLCAVKVAGLRALSARGIELAPRSTVGTKFHPSSPCDCSARRSPLFAARAHLPPAGSPMISPVFLHIFISFRARVKPRWVKPAMGTFLFFLKDGISHAWAFPSAEPRTRGSV